MDLEKLSPAPWTPMSFDPWSETDLEFIVLARNAFEVMMRRGWNPELHKDGWIACSQEGDMIGRYPQEAFPDPFTALVKADEWQTGQEKQRGD